MIDTPRTRVVVILVLLAVLGGSCIWFGSLSPNPAQGRYPHTEDLVNDQASYVGESVVINGEAVDTEPLTADSHYELIRDGTVERDSVVFTVMNASTHVTVGYTVQIYGVLRTDETVRAKQVIVVPSRNAVYMYAISFLAGLWTLTRLIRQWRLDFQRLAVTPRGDSDNLSNITDRTETTNTEDGDA